LAESPISRARGVRTLVSLSLYWLLLIAVSLYGPLVPVARYVPAGANHT